MRFLTRAGVTAGVLAAVVGVAGCGSTSGALLTPGAAAQLTSDLNQASTALADYNCAVATSALTSYRDDVSQLAGVNATLTEMLSQGATTISTLAQNRCPTGTVTTTSRTTTTSTTKTRTTGPQTTATTSTVSPPPTTDTTTGSGGAAPTTAPVTVTTAPAITTATAPVTTPDSGGAGLGGTDTGVPGGTAVAGGTGAVGGGGQ